MVNIKGRMKAMGAHAWGKDTWVMFYFLESRLNYTFMFYICFMYISLSLTILEGKKKSLGFS